LAGRTATLWRGQEGTTELFPTVLPSAQIKEGGDVRMAELAVTVSRPSAASGASV